VGAELRNSDADGAIAQIAAEQHGVISLAQLDLAGIHRKGRETRLKRGRLHRIHRGVFSVGHIGLSREGHWMAAVLAVGGGAALSHSSAGTLWGMLVPRRGQSGLSVERPIHVTVSGTAETRRGIRVHRSRTLTPDQVTIRWNIAVTNPSRTLLDLRRTLPQPQFAAALRQAEFLKLPIDSACEPDHTRSELEARFLALCRRHRIPQPEVNIRVGPFTVDFLWREAHLIVEVDGYRAHGSPSAFEHDRARDVQLALLGYEVLRLTWSQLNDQPRSVVAAVRGRLA
jgi:very-short-patch-repair endonuclease